MDVADKPGPRDFQKSSTRFAASGNFRLSSVPAIDYTPMTRDVNVCIHGLRLECGPERANAMTSWKFSAALPGSISHGPHAWRSWMMP